MFSWTSIKLFLIKQAVRILPKIGKAWLNSLLGKNKGEVISYRKENSRNVICFVHGFNGKPGQTFEKFPELIKTDTNLNGWDIFSIGFATDMMPTIRLGLWAELPDIDKLSRYLITNIQTLLGDYSRIAFVAHSMGGLVVQRAILDIDQQNRDRIAYLLLYGTPSNGLRKAKFARWINAQVNDMGFNSPFITKLREDWNSRFSHDLPFVFATVAGELDVFVPEESSLQPFSSGHANTSGNHIDMVKPDSVNHTSYAILKKTIVNNAPFLKTFTNEGLNNVLGDYAKIIHSLTSQINTIDRKSFREYIFALEGYKGIDNAIQGLEQSNRVQTDTDFMGILGGRYKRRFLLNHFEADKEKAKELYQKAFDISLGNGVYEQIYYHAINLAFIYLYGDENKNKMNELASEALKNANLDNSTGYWKFATIAEASLYLDDYVTAENNYVTAIDKAGSDQRAISSMYLNASYACIALDKNDWADKIDKLFSNRKS